MRDYIKRFLIAIIMALCVSLLFLGADQTDKSLQENKSFTKFFSSSIIKK